MENQTVLKQIIIDIDRIRTLWTKSAPIDCGCFPTVENRSRLVRLPGGDLEKSARAPAVTGAGGGQLIVETVWGAPSPDPIEAILQRTTDVIKVQDKILKRLL